MVAILTVFTVQVRYRVWVLLKYCIGTDNSISTPENKSVALYQRTKKFVFIISYRPQIQRGDEPLRQKIRLNLQKIRLNLRMPYHWSCIRPGEHPRDPSAS
eukprot:SAG11_NODE_291_length_11180_cov_102.040155_10_plen_101_part_00